MMEYHGHRYAVHGVGYCGETKTLAEALAAVTRSKGGTIYERLDNGAAQLIEVALVFEEYAEHIHDCPIALNQEQACNCGLEELHIAAAAVRTARRETTNA